MQSSLNRFHSFLVSGVNIRFLKLAVMDGVLFSLGARIYCTDYTFFDMVWTGKDDLWIRWVWFIGFIPCLSVSRFYLEDSPSLFINLAGSSRHDRIRSSAWCVTLLFITSLLISTAATCYIYIYID